MNSSNIYDAFSQDYDRFVDWESRLSVELPFLKKELSQVLENPNLPPQVLDVACGTGMHAIALSQAGFKLFGVDASSAMVFKARENAEKSDEQIEFREVGFSQLSKTFVDNKFDGLICLGNSLPHLLDKTSLITTLHDFKAVLKPNGKIIIQNRNFDQVLAERSRWMTPQTHRDKKDTWIFNRFYDFNPDGSLTFNIQILSSTNEGSFNQQVSSTKLWPMKKSDLEGAMRIVGFVDLHFYGNLQGETYDRMNSGNLVITASKNR